MDPKQLTGWDTESLHDLKQWRIRVADTHAYVNAPLKKAMDAANGTPVSHVLTRTFPETGTVWIRPVDPKTPGARLFRSSETLATATFSIAVPLAKLKFSLPPSRGLDFAVTQVEGEAEPTYAISFKDVLSAPRAVDEVALAQAQEARRERARAKKRKAGDQGLA
jgi:hypothetical protein